MMLTFLIFVHSLFIQSTPTPAKKPGLVSDGWHQPSALEKEFPTKVMSEEVYARYDSVEQSIASLAFENANEIDFSTAGLSVSIDILSNIAKALPTDLSSSEAKRFEFLLNKSVPLPHSEHLLKLLFDYTRYQTALASLDQSSSLSNQDLVINQKVDDQKSKEALQQEIFGKQRANNLFGRDNLNVRYLLERQVLLKDPNINDSQRQQQLLLLEQAHKNRLRDLAKELAQ
jgi:hypothetical protein